MSNSKFYIIPGNRYISSSIKESGSNFLCPSNTVMTGRYHTGDENGRTQYEYASLKAVDEYGNPVAGAITVENVRWETSIKESSGNGFDAPYARIIVGRKHSGDENGQTQYATAIIKIDGKPTVLEEGTTSLSIKESSGIWFKTDAERIMTGRHHSGDENGKTYYTSAKVAVVNSSTEPAPSGTIIVPNVRMISAAMKESNSSFICPPGTVMTGRSHTGDENGNTQYEYSTLKAINSNGEIVIGSITVEDVRWDDALQESSGTWFNAVENRIIVGRKHSGDENGQTQYATAIIKFNGRKTYVQDVMCSIALKESSGIWFKTDSKRIITGRNHYEDENGNSFFNSGVIHTEVGEKTGKIKIIIALHPNEGNYPMNPDEFISLSRFRKHIEGGEDYGYNKNTNSFVAGDSHGSEYYNIPVSIINSFHLTGENILYNLRPRDKNSIGTNEFFLQPDEALKGDFSPTGNVAVFTCSSYYTDINSKKNGERKEFWIFYGYNKAGAVGISFSHQGDWERVIVDIVDNEIQGAWLSQHTNLVYYPANQLDIKGSNGTQILKIYSAQGSHAHYNKVGKFPIYNLAGVTIDNDYSKDGYQWEITRRTEELSTQPWALFAGAWGEIGTGIQPWGDSTSGPLGPLYKIWDFGVQKDENIPLVSLISSNQILIVPNIRYESEIIKESGGIDFTAPTNMLITGRKHNEDENGGTQYQYASLKAVDFFGKAVNGLITISDLQWSEEHKESDSANFFQAPEGRVITGRQHFGDENGNTRYQTGIVRFNEKPVTVLSASSILPMTRVKESVGIFYRTASKFVLVGRTHSGDENGETCYYQGYLRIDK